MSNTPRRVAIIVVVVGLTACGADDSPSDASPATEPATSSIDPPTSTETSGVTSPSSEPTEPSAPESTPTVPPDTHDARDDLDPVVIAAIDELAVAQDRSPAEIEFVIFERVTWRSGALGCPQPGLSYTQALVDGYRIVLSLDGIRYEFHGAAGAPPFLCDDPQDPARGKRRRHLSRPIQLTASHSDPDLG